jgi:hypothetical protein
MSVTEAEIEAWPLGELEEVISDLRATVDIFGHLIDAMHVNEVGSDAWRKVEIDLALSGKRIEELWHRAWDANKAEIAALKADHEAALTAVRAEKAAPGSVETAKRAEAMWSLLWSFTKVATEYCIEAGHPPHQSVDMTASKPPRGKAS